MIRLFHNEERGTALTEFVMFLPIFIICFIGVGNLIKAGMGLTRVEMIGQKNVWAEAIDLTDKELSDIDEHMVPVTAAFNAGETLAGLNVEENPQDEVDLAEGVLYGVGLGAAGHWGESYERAIILKVATYANNIDDITAQPEDILGPKSDNPFPHLLLSDSAAQSVQNNFGSGSSGGLSAEGIIQDLITGSGIVQAMAAGIRYGVVFGEHEDDFELMAGFPSKHYESHHDLLVGPDPLIGDTEHNLKTFGMAFLLVQTIEEYRVMQRFGKSEWDGGFDNGRAGRAEDAADDRYDEEYDDELEAQCAEIIANLPDNDGDGEPDEDPPDECD